VKPILVVSDSPDCPSGLGRIGRDVALRLHNAGAQVGYCGYWGSGQVDTWTGKALSEIDTRKARYTEAPPYAFLAAGPDPTKHLIPVMLAADEFFGEGPGVVLFLYDPTWLIPFGGGDAVEGAGWENIAVQAWARRRRERGVELWGAFPVDAHCPSGKLPSITCNLLKEFDRVGAWTNYGRTVLAVSVGAQPEHAGALPLLPLGLDPLWLQGDAERGGQILGVIGRPILGAVGTNQIRKDWGLVFQAFSLMPAEWILWAHIDRRHDYWNLSQLVEEYELGDRVRFTKPLSDEQLADCYAACAVTFGLGRGEGFGYPILESQLAGTPCVTFDYGGGAELTPNRVQTVVLRPEGPYSFLRPVVDPELLANRLQGWMGFVVAQDPQAWLWENVWPTWEKWFKEGGVLGP